MRRFLFFVLPLTLSKTIYAQDLQNNTAIESPEKLNTSAETTENLNSGRGGFLGLGGQKPLQKVGGIPLPNRQARLPTNPLAGQPISFRENLAGIPIRRSKPMMGELTTDFPARFIYLNGKNISNVREQRLDGVNVQIDAQGNIHISAPHYDVQESTHYRPLLPHEVPRINKPSSSDSEAALMPSRQSKASRPSSLDTSDSASNKQTVPPVGTADTEIDDEPAETSTTPRKEASSQKSTSDNNANKSQSSPR